MLAALGIVFGDIGTSPLYALRECFTHSSSLTVSPENVLGVLSLIFWALTIVICGKYMLVVMRADNKGEGGTLALMALALKGLDKNSWSYKLILFVGLAGATLLYGDGIITPAISVLSAVEGISIVTPALEHWVVPITLIIIVFLFVFQNVGTARIGGIFGPIILLWFIVIGTLGLSSIIENPQVLHAINPTYALNFFADNKLVALVTLGFVFLVVTGGEALYADMGHFGIRPIRIAWFSLVMPGLVLNYFGQGALLLMRPEAISSPFYLLAPEWAVIPLVVLSTCATVIASQALISGVFSITRQAVQMGFCPRITIKHTSSAEIGQIYVPFVNWAMFIGVAWLVLNFKTSSNLASAYGLAVTMDMVITSILAAVVAVRLWKWKKPLIMLVFGALLIIDISFFLPNALKFFSGGWVPILVAIVLFVLMTTWQKGRRVLAERLKARSIAVDEFITKISEFPPQRVSGTAIYMSSDPWGIPVPLLHNLKHNKVIHQRIILLTISTKDSPFVNREDRITLEEIDSEFYRIIAHYGFMETPKIRHIFEAARAQGLDIHAEDSTFVLGRETILPSTSPGMALWREQIFAFMSKNAARPTAFFKIPPNQVIEVGVQIEI